MLLDFTEEACRVGVHNTLGVSQVTHVASRLLATLFASIGIKPVRGAA